MKTYPLLQSQLGVFMEWMKDPSVTQYNLPTCTKMPKTVDVQRLQKGFERICQERSTLRTRFVMVDGEPRQYVDDEMKIPVTVRTMTDQETAQYIERDFVRPYDLLSGEPLIRIEIIEAETFNWLLVDIHHTIGDGLTLAPNMTIYDVPAAYNGEPLQTVEYGMYEYAEDEQLSFGTENYERAAQYYKDKFAGLDFISLAANPEGRLGDMVRESAFMPVDEVDQWCKDNGISSNLLFMAAYSLVLSRLSREQQVVYESVNHGRMDKRLARAYGMFVKSVPILADVVPEENVMDFIKGFRRELMATIRYGAYPFSHFCQDLGIKPGVSFGFQGVAMQEYFELEGERCTPVQLPKGRIDGDMSCVIYQREGQYDIRMESSDALNSKSTLRMVADAIKTAAEYMMAHPEARVDEVKIVTAEAEKALIALSCGKKLPLDSDTTFVKMIKKHAAEHPDAIAVVDSEGSYTYREFDKQSDVLASYLIKAGVGTDHFVGIMLKRRKEFLLSVLAIQKAGCAYIPLDMDYPADRLRYMLEDSEAKVLITTSDIIREKQETDGLTIDESITKTLLIEQVDFSGDSDSVDLSSPERLAYVIYTSGSTGKPKGVMLPHRALVAYLTWRVAELGLDGNSRLACHASFSFDASLDDLFSPLAAGGTCYIIPEEIRKDMDAMRTYLVDNNITGMTMSTQLGMAMLNEYPDLPLQFLMMGGEKMLPFKNTNIKVINGYGPTEFTVCSSFHVVDQKKDTNIPIGRPVPNTYSFILDEKGNFLPQGVMGELCLAGPQIANGYLHREDLTAEKFVQVGDMMVYRTGDLARYNAEGELEYGGRIDSMVKLRGFRIELGEIENASSQYAGIQAVAAEVKEIGAIQHLCLYYTANQEIDEDKFRDFLAESLADYMVPTVFMKMDTMPMTPNGKINRKALPLPELKAMEIVAPENETEQQLLDIITDILGTSAFGVTTNLVSVGMTSMTAMKYCARIQVATGIQIPTALVIKHPTVREIAIAVNEAGKQAGQQGNVAKKKQEYYPLTENQKGIYLEWEMNRETIQYNIPFACRFDQVDADALVAAVKKTVDAHAYMKARLTRVNGEVMQQRRDDDAAEVSLIVLDKDYTTEEMGKKLQTRLRPFDLFNESLYRIEVYKAPAATYLLMDVHHIVFDGISTAVVLADLLKAYHGMPLQPESYTAFDFALDEQEIKESAQYKEAEKYFGNLVSESSVAVYPSSASTDGVTSSVVETTIPMEDIDQFCSRTGVTAGSYLQAAFVEVMQRISREEMPLTLTISSGRAANVGLQQSVGMYVKTLPVVYPVVKNGGVVDFVKAMHQQLQNSYGMDFYPYTKIVEDYKVHAEMMFLYQGGLSDDIQVENGEVIRLQLDTVKFPVTVMTYPENGRYVINIEYDGMRYCKAHIEKLLNAIATIAQTMATADTLSELSIVAAEEKTAIMSLSEGEKLEYDKSQTWIDMFLQHVKEQPDADALVDYKSKVSYAEMNRQSIKLARILIDKGVTPGSVVAIMLPRVKEFFISVLAIQRAGAAYVPVDMNYPEDRKQYMIEDSCAQVVIDSEMLAGCHLEDAQDDTLNLATPEGAAYMIYTSGSTGKPKGVPVSHRGIRACAAWNIAAFDLKPGKRNLNHPSFSFDASTFDLFYPLAAGAAIYVVSDAMHKDMDSMAAYIRDNKITGMTMSTALGMALLNQYDLNIEYIMLGGEKFVPVKKTPTKLFNGYGPTEFTVCSSYHIIDQDKDVDIPIGRPVPNSFSFICDKYGNLLPQGIPGELCLAGTQMAEGYWHRPELTAEKFGDCPFMSGKMYRTGDLARYNEDGELEFMGRIDNQVKLRGFRIELGEIEARAAQYPGITAVAAEVKVKNNTQHLVLYFVSSKEINKDELQEFMGQTLTDYMVPNVYMQLEAMPMTPNGKVNRKLLPEPVINLGEIIAPETDTEKQLFDIVKNTLKLSEFGVTNNLVGLGLSSLVAMRLAAAIQQQMNVSVKLAELMKDPTVRGLARLIDQESDSGIALKATELKDYYPLSENQKGVYVDWEMNREALQYNIPSTYKFADKDAGRLSAAVRSVIDAHPYMKTRLAMVDGEAKQQRRYEAETIVEDIVLTNEPDAAYFQQFVRPFDLFNDDLYRIKVVKAPSAVYLFMDIHHIIFDGMSTALFLGEILAAYDGTEPQKETITAFDFAEYDHQIASSEQFKVAEQHFDSILTDSSVVVYPDSAKPDGVKAAIVETQIPQEDILGFCKTNDITVGSYFQAVFAETVSRLTREANPLYVTINNGRSANVELLHSVGMYVKTLPVGLTSKLAEHKDVVGFAKTMHEQLQSSYANDIYPYTKMVEKYGVRAEILYIYQGGIADNASVSGIEQVDLALDTTKFALSIFVYPTGNDYTIRIEYDGMRYGKQDMRVLAETIGTAAQNMTKADNLRDVELISATEKKNIIQLSHGESMDFDRNLNLVDLFTAQAKKTPDNIAVVYKDCKMTYREVDEVTDRLAVHLSKKFNLGPEQFVGVMIERSELMVVYPLAIMKTGAAYMPLDFKYPADRLHFMCEDAGVKLILTEMDGETSRAKQAIPDFDGDIFVSSDIASLPQVTDEEVAALQAAKPENAFIVLYTSGSTGKPKGVMLEHHSIVNFTILYARDYEMTEKDHAMAYSNFGFDCHMLDIYPALHVGASVYIIPSEIRLNLPALSQFIDDNELTIGFMTTQLGYMLATTYKNPSLRLFSVAGEKLQAIKQPDYRFINGYGPTETTLYATYYDIVGYYDNGLIGRPSANYSTYVVDRYLHLMPKGVPGELIIGGEGVGRGYLNRPDLTKEKFITYQDEPGYRTGDLVRWSDDGNIDFMGRIDTQVKLRGFRIELGEIENKIAEFPGITQKVVDVKEIGGAQNLCAYFVADREIDVEELKKFLAQDLADYMVPTAFMQMEKLPYNANGKIDRKILPLPVIEVGEIIAPETETEKKVFDIVAETLKHNQFGVTTNLVSIGLTSLVSMRMGVQLFNTFNVSLKLAEVMVNPTVRNIANIIDEKKKAESADVFSNLSVKAPAADAPAKKKVNLFAKKK